MPRKKNTKKSKTPTTKMKNQEKEPPVIKVQVEKVKEKQVELSQPAPKFLANQRKSKSFFELRDLTRTVNGELSRQPSFRQKISNAVPLLRRTLINRVSGLKESMNRLSGSMDILSIDEDRELKLEAQKKEEEERKEAADKEEEDDWGSLGELQTRCPQCNRVFSFKNITEKSEKELTVEAGDFGGNLYRTSSVQDIGRKESIAQRLQNRFSWHGGSFRHLAPKERRNSKPDAKDSNRSKCSYCGHGLNYGAEAGSSYYDLEVRSRSLTHIDQIEQAAQGMLIKDMDGNYTSELLVPPDSTQARRQQLSRSEATSSECFTVSFEGLGEDQPHDFVTVSSNTNLGDSLVEICNKRGIDLNQSNVFLDANQSPLPSLSIDTSWMGGKHIRIKVNDKVVLSKRDKQITSISQTPSRKVSSSLRSGKTSRTYSASSEDPSCLDPGVNLKSNKRWSGFFGMSKDTSKKLESLIEILKSYDNEGIPGVFYNYDDDEYKLEEDWKVIVNYSQLTDRHQQQQAALWELLTTELAYIKTIRVVTDLFLACLQNLQSKQLLTEIDKHKLFSNIEEIHSCNDRFWREHIVAMVQTSRDTKQPLDPMYLYEAFMNFGTLFKAYEIYCSEQTYCQHYCREKLQQEQDNELFPAYLAWCEAQKDCNRLKLMDILVKPMQRLTKYGLLLKAVLKHTENLTYRDSLISMISQVEQFVNSVNTTVKQHQDFDIVKALLTRIESYDVVETRDEELSNIVQKYATLDLTINIPNTCHKRALVYESDLKFKDVNNSSKIEVHCLLFTDILLVTKLTKRLGDKTTRMKVVRQPYNIERLVVQESTKDTTSLFCVYLTEYETASTAFILSSSETKFIKHWAEVIRKAKHVLKNLKNSSQQLPISRQASGFNEDDDENYDSNHRTNLSILASRSPRGSSRGSRISSLAQSHSGSMEMTENISSLSSVSASRGVSVENSDLRGSSLSSDEGQVVNLVPSPSRNERLPSPRNERREVSPRKDPPSMERKSLSRKPSPKPCNTLTVQVPHLGQSLPNLNLASSPGSHVIPPTSLLLAPPKSSHCGLLSPTHRGTSYPPPSPPRGSLKRGFAILPKNPLVKTCHISTDLTRSASVGPSCASEEIKSEIAAVVCEPAPIVDSERRCERSEDHTKSTVALQTSVEEPKHIGLQTSFSEAQTSEEADSTEGPDDSDRCQHCGCSSNSSSLKGKLEPSKRLLRTDNKRYHTAGTIEDLKKIKSRDTSIYKRFSLNYGNESKQQSDKHKHLSVTSIQSSSGVSSVGSSVDRLFTNETNEFNFDQVLSLVNKQIEQCDLSAQEPTGTSNLGTNASDLEEFENKVAEWRRFGFNSQSYEDQRSSDVPSQHITNTYISSVPENELQIVESGSASCHQPCDNQPTTTQLFHDATSQQTTSTTKLYSEVTSQPTSSS